MTLLCLEFKISKLERLPCVVRHFVVVSQIFESNLEKDFSHITNIFRHKGTVLHSCYISIQVYCYCLSKNYYYKLKAIKSLFLYHLKS